LPSSTLHPFFIVLDRPQLTACSYYGTTFFANSGISNPFLITIATNVVNMGTTPFGMWASDKVGRRPLMLIGAGGMAVAQLIVAITGTAISQDNAAGQKVLVAVSCGDCCGSLKH